MEEERGGRLDAVACNTIYHVCAITHVRVYIMQSLEICT